MEQKSAIQRFLKIAAEDRFKGWPLVEGSLTEGAKIPFFGSTINYQLQTPNGVEDYTSIIRSFGWGMVFGVTKDGMVITIAQWKPGVNAPSWEMPPGGIGKLGPDVTAEEILEKTQTSYTKETGYGNGKWTPLGRVVIETGKYRGAGPNDHGLNAYMFLATDLEKIGDARQPNANEIIETLEVPISEFEQVLDSHLFVETSAVACAYKALMKLGQIKWANELA